MAISVHFSTQAVFTFLAKSVKRISRIQNSKATAGRLLAQEQNVKKNWTYSEKIERMERERGQIINHMVLPEKGKAPRQLIFAMVARRVHL